MAELLRQGSRGEEVRRLQKNLNAAVGRRYGAIAVDGIFGPRTKQAVERYQKDFRLKSVDGIVGPETRNALATRVVILTGSMSRAMSPPSPNPSAQTVPTPPVMPSTPQQPASPPASPFLVQLQPALGLTPPPFLSRPKQPGPTPPSIVAGQLAFGIVYRTAPEGPHWEFGGAFQPSFNSRNQPTDPSPSYSTLTQR